MTRNRHSYTAAALSAVLVAALPWLVHLIYSLLLAFRAFRFGGCVRLTPCLEPLRPTLRRITERRIDGRVAVRCGPQAPGADLTILPAELYEPADPAAATPSAPAPPPPMPQSDQLDEPTSMPAPTGPPTGGLAPPPARPSPSSLSRSCSRPRAACSSCPAARRR